MSERDRCRTGGPGRSVQAGASVFGGLTFRTRAVAVMVFALVVVAPCHAFAGAWTQPKGHTYSRTTLSFYSTDEHFNGDGELFVGDWWDASASFSSVQIHQVIEHGLEEDLTFVADGVFKSLSVERAGTEFRDDRVAGLGDVGVGLRYRFRNEDVIASVQGRIEAPGGYNEDRLDYALGDGGVNGEGRLQLGGSAGEFRPNYWSAEVGYRLRGGDYDDDFVYAGAFGLELLRRVWGRVGVSGVSNQGETVLDIEEATADIRQGSSWLAYGVALAYVASPSLTFEVGLGGELAGKNTFRGNGIGFTLELRH